MVLKVESREKRQNRVASRLRSGLRLAPTTARKTLCPLSLPYLRFQDPRGGLGNSKNRNLERLGVPLARLGGPTKGGLGNSKSRNLEFGGPSGCGPKWGPRKLLADPDRGPSRKLGNSRIWNLQRSILANLHRYLGNFVESCARRPSVNPHTRCCVLN
jgi:hypothetical protein